MSLLFNLLSRLVIAFLPGSKRLLISWLQSPSSVTTLRDCIIDFFILSLTYFLYFSLVLLLFLFCLLFFSWPLYLPTCLAR